LRAESRKHAKVKTERQKMKTAKYAKYAKVADIGGERARVRGEIFRTTNSNSQLSTFNSQLP
jgi:hypothetical protein